MVTACNPDGVLSRRKLLVSAALAVATTNPSSARAATGPILARSRVIVDNDFAADPDGLFQLAHQVLSPASQIMSIIASHSHKGESWGDARTDREQVAASAEKARTLLALTRSPLRPEIIDGSASALQRGFPPERNAVSERIISEALRTDANDTPLYYSAGGGLTELARAWLIDRRIGRNITLSGSAATSTTQPQAILPASILPNTT